MVAWNLAPGDKIRRTELHLAYGGQQQGGVSPSNQSPNVFLFSDPASGLQHGYVDHWDGATFHFTGEGQRGDQRLVAGNKAIFNTTPPYRALRVFRGARGVVEYVGEFRLDPETPWYSTDAPETGGGPIRSVIVFRLVPIGHANTDRLPAADLHFDHVVDVVPIEAMNTEKAWVDPDRVPYEAERRESALVQQFQNWIESRNHKCARLRIVPAGEVKPIFSDIWVASLNTLIEAKGTCTREAVRMAIGQLIDYQRFQKDAKLAILLPSEPRADLRELAHSAGVSVYWPEGTAFRLST